MDDLKAGVKRQRALLSQLDNAALAKDQRLAGCVQKDLITPLAAELRFQEVVFLPLLAQAALPVDGLEILVAQAQLTFSELRRRRKRVEDTLGRLAAGGEIEKRSEQDLRRYSALLRGHLMVLLSILLPLAAMRFCQRELDILAAGLAEFDASRPRP